MEKIFIKANELLKGSFELARKVHQAMFLPDMIAAIWRGGTPVGIAVHEYFHYKEGPCKHTAIKACSYLGIDKRSSVEVDNIDYLLKDITETTKVLLVDDVFDTGNTMKRLKEEFLKKSDAVKIATLYYKPTRNETDITPDFYKHETDKWIVFPHELEGLNLEEVKQKGMDLYDILKD